MKNFWATLPKPFLVQAPMENATDTVFRQMIKECGKPDVFFTEFTNTEGLLSKGYERVAQRLQFTKTERPLVAQIWGTKPESYFKATQLLIPMGFDGIDINMGCPDKTIVKKGACSGLIHNPPLAKEIIDSVRSAAPNLPLSVKTRCGVNSWVTTEWISFLLEQNLQAITLHGRIAIEMSNFPARWEEIKKAVEIRNQLKKDTIIIGNGDVSTYQEALEKHKEYGVDGIMIGRGIFTNLWIFNKEIIPELIPTKEKLEFLIKHIQLYEKTWGNKKPFEVMKKYYKIYVTGMHNATDIRSKLMEYNNAKDTVVYIQSLINNL